MNAGPSGRSTLRRRLATAAAAGACAVTVLTTTAFTGAWSPPAPGPALAADPSVGAFVAAPVETLPDPAPPTRTSTVVVPGVPGRVTLLTDLRYATASPSEVLDLWLPPHTGRLVPLVIFLHGGAFVEGDKSDYAPMAEPVLRSGYAVASINYRMTGEQGFPAAVQDTKAAVRWLRAHARAYELRADRFGVWGESAGGYLAAMVGATGSQHTGFDVAALGNAATSSAVQAVVDEYGPTDFLTMDAESVVPGGCPGDWWMRHDDPDSPDSLWLGGPAPLVPAVARSASVLTYVAKAAKGTLPPFAVDHGAEDCTVPYGQSLDLVRALRARKAQVSFTLVAEAGHSDPLLHDRMDAPTIHWLHTILDRR